MTFCRFYCSPEYTKDDFLFFDWHNTVMNRQLKGIPSIDNAKLSRRGFLKGSAAIIAAASASLLVQTGCSPSSNEQTTVVENGDSVSKLSVSSDQVFTTDACEYIDDIEEVFKVVSKTKLPYKTLLRAGDDEVAATLVPCETSTPLAQVGILRLQDAEHRIILENPVGADEGYAIFDACASAEGVMWTEQNVLKNTWRIYTASLSGLSLGTPTLVDEGDSSWTLPSMAVVGKYAFWLLTPQSSAARAADGGCVKRHVFGESADSAYVYYECNPKIACDLAKDSSGIVVSHYNDSSSSYAITRIDADDANITDTIVMPSLLKPIYVGYGNTGFAFSLEDIYNGEGGIGNIGTYTSAGDDEGWFRFARTPLCGPAWIKDWFIVKSTRVVAGVNIAGRKYFSIEPENATQDYGEFLASSGNCERILTYSNIDYTPLNGEKIKACQVRVWEVA